MKSPVSLAKFDLIASNVKEGGDKKIKKNNKKLNLMLKKRKTKKKYNKKIMKCENYYEKNEIKKWKLKLIKINQKMIHKSI